MEAKVGVLNKGELIIMNRQQLLNEYEFYIWDILSDLRAYEDWNYENADTVLMLLRKISEICINKNKIEKSLAETFISLPELIIECGEHDIIYGDEIMKLGKEFKRYRDMIINSGNKDFIKDKRLYKKISYLESISIGENGFLKLLSEKNIYDNEKVENTFRILDEMIDIYKEEQFIDTYLVYVLMIIYRIIFIENYQDIPEISQNVSKRFSDCLKEILKYE